MPAKKNRIRLFLDGLNINQTEFAIEYEMSRAYLNEIMRGRFPGPGIRQKLVQGLGAPEWVLWPHLENGHREDDNDHDTRE